MLVIGALSGLLPEKILLFGEVSISTNTAKYLHENWGFTTESHTTDSMQLLACLLEVLDITKMTADSCSASPVKIAYMMSRFPKLTETFILEVGFEK